MTENRYLTHTIQNITNKRRIPTLIISIKNGEDIVAQACATKYKRHDQFGNNVTVISEFQGEKDWEIIRLLIKKLQAQVRSDFPGTDIILDDGALEIYSKELTEAGAKKVQDGVYNITILDPLF